MKTTNNTNETMVVTVDTMVAEFRNILNAGFLQLKRERERGHNVIASPSFYAKVVREYLGKRKINKKFQSAGYRASVCCDARDHAIYACYAPARRENAAMYQAEARACGLF